MNVNPLSQTDKEMKEQFWDYAKKYTSNTRETKLRVNDENKEVIKALYQYFTNDPAFWDNKTVMNEPSLRKGIWLAGNTGSGKTLLLEIFSKYKLKHVPFEMISTREMNRRFNSKGHDGIAKYSYDSVRTNATSITSINHVAFDDLGNEESETVYFNNIISVMEHVLDERYRHFTKHQLITHVTTNMTLDQVGETYGNRIKSRVNEMFNIIYLGSKENSKDYRITTNSNN